MPARSLRRRAGIVVPAQVLFVGGRPYGGGVEHLKKDLGTLKKGATVVVTLRNQANVLLMDSNNYRRYASGRSGNIKYVGGLVKRSPARITVPTNGHWILAVDLGGAVGRINAKVSVEAPPRGNLPEFRSVAEPTLSGSIATRTPTPPTSATELNGQTWDVFLSHASEDKETVAVPLAKALEARGVTVWLDQAVIRMGDSLRQRIDRGIRSSRFAAVVLSDAYFSKGWTQYELDGIVTLGVGGRQNLLPIWHGVDHAGVAANSPSLADKLARSTADTTVDAIADEIAELVNDARRAEGQRGYDAAD